MSKKKRLIKRRIIPWLFLLPSLILVSIIVLIPFVDAVRRSFFQAMGSGFVGIKNYQSALDNEAFKLAAANTARFAAVCIPILLVFSLLLGLAINAANEIRGIFKTTFLIPFAIPVASVVLLWKAIFHENGLFNVLIKLLGGEPIPWLDSPWALAVLVFTYIWKNAGYNMVLWLSGISGINPSLYEAAQVDGAGAFKRLIYITIPGLIPTFFTVTVLSLLNSFKVFREAYLMSGSYPHDSVYMLQHLFNNWFLNLDVDRMCAAAVMTASVVFVLISLLQRVWGKDPDQ